MLFSFCWRHHIFCSIVFFMYPFLKAFVVRLYCHWNMEITNILLHCLQFGVQAMNNECEYKSKICVTSKKNVTFFSNKRIDRLLWKIVSSKCITQMPFWNTASVWKSKECCILCLGTQFVNCNYAIICFWQSCWYFKHQDYSLSTKFLAYLYPLP